jgi:hypothetical protein
MLDIGDSQEATSDNHSLQASNQTTTLLHLQQQIVMMVPLK